MAMDDFQKILAFLSQLNLDVRLPTGVAVMNPYRDPAVWSLCGQFYAKYCAGHYQRIMILGINPGRFGGGATGIPFTDPVKLENVCQIPNSLKKKTELSADFIYDMIAAFGGAHSFYSQFYLGACCPLGFTRNGINLNYYDLPELEKAVTPFIVNSLRRQLTFGINRKNCFCLGEGKNFRFLSTLNKTYGFFDKVIPLAHPRFIMQYRRKKKDAYIEEYVSRFNASRH
jgi:hypothetical protein